jgi:orotidine-5'-phosphate decarboxylase
MTAPHPARAHLALALDVDSLDTALAMLLDLHPWFGVAKVGLQLFSAAGPVALTAPHTLGADIGVDVFADLKLHDIPTTVGGAARAVGRTGARYLTTHAAGGEAMVRAAVDGFSRGAAEAGHIGPVTLAVTVLTSDGDAGPEVLDHRVAVARAARCPGLVCSPLDVTRARSLYPGAVTVCPGVRPAGAAADDQARIATPAATAKAGADVLVVGRAVSGAADPRRAAAAVADEVAEALAG